MAMKGEPINLQNFKKNFDEEIEGLRHGIHRASNEAAPIIDRIKEEGPEVKGEVVEKIAQLVSMMEKKADDLKGQKSFKDLKRKLFKNS